MTDTSYNGWTNYATWRVNLEIFDSLEPEYFGLSRGEELKHTDVHELADALKDCAEGFIVEQSTGLAEAYALAFLADVNWREISQHIIDNYSREVTA